MTIYWDLVGRRFGSLLVKSKADSINGKSKWVCACDCGKEIIYRGTLLASGYKTHCGCNKTKTVGGGGFSFGDTLGLVGTTEFDTWRLMMTRCYYQGASNFRDYGGRGISVCERWQSFPQFLADMGIRPSKKHSIDRVNVDGNYEPSNCRWDTKTEQANNTRANRRITFNGETHTLSEWATIKGQSQNSLAQRLDKLKWPIERALNEPQRKLTRRRHRVLWADGCARTLSEWAEITGLPIYLIAMRLKLGWSESDAVLKPHSFPSRRATG